MYELVEPGESFDVDGEPQVFELLQDPKDNPNIEVVFAAMIPGLQMVQREMIALKEKTNDGQEITDQMRGDAVNTHDLFVEIRRNLNWSLGLVPDKAPEFKRV